MAYTSALLNVSLAGPTLFGPVISNAALIASQSLANGGRKYFVLLIITVRVKKLDLSMNIFMFTYEGSIYIYIYCDFG